MKENNFIDSNILIYAHTRQDENKMKIAQGILSSDQIIIASALQNECSILYSEDLHHSQKIEKTLTIINPFI